MAERREFGPKDLVVIDARSRIILPKEIREKAGLSSGDTLVAVVEPDGSVLLKKARVKVTV